MQIKMQNVENLDSRLIHMHLLQSITQILHGHIFHSPKHPNGTELLDALSKLLAHATNQIKLIKQEIIYRFQLNEIFLPLCSILRGIYEN